MDETRRAWDEVGEGFVKIGRIISERYRQLGEEQASRPAAPDEGAAADAVRRATDELDRAYKSVGDTLNDDEAREHMKDAGRKLTDALKITLAELSEEVRRAVGSGQPPGQGGPPAPAPPSPPPPDSGSSG